MKIERITENKKQFLDLLLLADEQENMIDRYLPDGDLFALYDGDLKSVCVVVPVNSETCELKNIATYEKYQGKGYGRALINFIFDFYKNDYKSMLVGTGETPAILSFYERCGFVRSHRVKNFFTDHYDHPMFEGDIQLVDMIYLKKDLTVPRSRVSASAKFSRSAPREMNCLCLLYSNSRPIWSKTSNKLFRTGDTSHWCSQTRSGAQEIKLWFLNHS